MSVGLNGFDKLFIRLVYEYPAIRALKTEKPPLFTRFTTRVTANVSPGAVIFTICYISVLVVFSVFCCLGVLCQTGKAQRSILQILCERERKLASE